MNNPVITTPSDRLNIWTIGAISVVAYALAVFLHEGVGHGGACLLLGGKPLTLNAIFFSYDFRSVSTTGGRIIASAGCVVNFLTALIGLRVLRAVPTRAESCRYFLWLFSAVNLLMAFGYLLFSGVAGIGDWAIVTRGFEPQVVIRGMLILVGAVLYFVVAPRMLVPGAQRFFDRDADLQVQVRRLIRTPYIIGGVTLVVAGLFNPNGFKLVIISAAAASFGGTSLLAWYPFERDLARTESAAPLSLKRSAAWIVAAVATAALFIGVLGPGIRL